MGADAASSASPVPVVTGFPFAPCTHSTPVKSRHRQRAALTHPCNRDRYPSAPPRPRPVSMIQHAHVCRAAPPLSGRPLLSACARLSLRATVSVPHLPMQRRPFPPRHRHRQRELFVSQTFMVFMASCSSSCDFLHGSQKASIHESA